MALNLALKYYPENIEELVQLIFIKLKNCAFSYLKKNNNNVSKKF